MPCQLSQTYLLPLFELPSPFARVRAHSLRLYRMTDRLMTQAALAFSLCSVEHCGFIAKKDQH